MESKLKKSIKEKPVDKPRYTIAELEKMREFAVSQINRLTDAGSKDQTLLDYLDAKRKKAEEEIKRLQEIKGEI